MYQIYCQDSRMIQKEVQVESRVRENFMHGLVGEGKQTGHSMCRGRFTLIELLIVIAIISILAAMLLPALKMARDSAKQSICANNEKQIGLGIMLYTNEYDGWLPAGRLDGNPNGVAALPRLDALGYIKNELTCPTAEAAGVNSFGYNIYFGYFDSNGDPVNSWDWMLDTGTMWKCSRVKRPSEKVLVADHAGTSGGLGYIGDVYHNPKWQFIAYRHNMVANWLFMDGHVKSFPRSIYFGTTFTERCDQWLKPGK